MPNCVQKNLIPNWFTIKKHLKTKTKYYEGKSNIIFYYNAVPKEVSHCICPLLILIGSVFEIDKSIIHRCF